MMWWSFYDEEAKMKRVGGSGIMARLFLDKRRAFATIVFGGSILVGATVSFAGEKEANRCPLRQFGQFSEWSEPINLGPVVNSEFNDRHPAISPNGLSLYITSDRPGA
jgi:hypothetical protein